MPQPPKPPLRAHASAWSRAIASGCLLAALALAGSAAAAFDFNGRKALVAVTADGARTPLGHIDFTPVAGAPTTFRLALKTEVFTDHFLSMREFKCLNAAQEISCHVPYPYAHPATVGPGQLAWLEHSLLFLIKRPAEFGAKLWNGVYYEFQEQGPALVGRPQAVDLNAISAPPGDPSTPPFKPALRHEMPAQARWLRELVIE
jgi:hypothetical protein